jgi:N-carbamoylputrescine amidase
MEAIMTVGLVSAEFINNNVDFNLENCINFINKAKKNGVDIILFGETYLQGFEALIWKSEDDLKVGLERDSGIMNILRMYCKEKDIAIGVGYIEREGNNLYSSYLVIDKNGNDLTNYRRISRGWRIKDSDNEIYREGTEFYIFEFMGHKMTVGLCGDFWTDEVIKKLPKEIDLVLWPVFVDIGRVEWETSELNEYIEQSKKIHRNIFYVNSICKEQKSLAHGGAFAVIDNKLNRLLDQGKEEILVIKY